jgi:plasmid stabilization system protein ParE
LDQLYLYGILNFGIDQANRYAQKLVECFANIANNPRAFREVSEIRCGFPQSEEELFFLFPQAIFPLVASQRQDAIAQCSDLTVVELGGSFTSPIKNERRLFCFLFDCWI